MTIISNLLSRTDAAALIAKIQGGAGRTKRNPFARVSAAASVTGVLPKKKVTKSKAAKKLYEPAHSRPEPGVDIIDIPAYAPSLNEVINLYKYGQGWVVEKWKSDATKALRMCCNRYLPEYCLDADLRKQISLVVLTRRTPGDRQGKGLDPDNLSGGLKPLLDSLCGFIVDGPLFEMTHAKTGGYDDIVFSDVNPSGRLDVRYSQEVNSRIRRHGIRIELQRR